MHTDSLRADVDAIARPEGRMVGSPGHARARAYLERLLDELSSWASAWQVRACGGGGSAERKPKTTDSMQEGRRRAALAAYANQRRLDGAEGGGRTHTAHAYFLVYSGARWTPCDTGGCTLGKRTLP